MFRNEKEQIGKTNLLQQKIHSGDTPPIRQSRVNEFWCTIMKSAEDCCKSLLDQNVVSLSSSHWGSPVVLVMKDRLSSFCADYCKLNSDTQIDAYSLLSIDETLDALAGLNVYLS